MQKGHHFDEEIFVTRKGAVSARKGELGIIPGSMEAKKKFTIADQIKATAHVECCKDANVIDKILMAYKDIDAVMTAQNELVEIVH